MIAALVLRDLGFDPTTGDPREVQPLLYLVQEILGVQLGYFFRWNLGIPFSREVWEDFEVIARYAEYAESSDVELLRESAKGYFTGTLDEGTQLKLAGVKAFLDEEGALDLGLLVATHFFAPRSLPEYFTCEVDPVRLQLSGEALERLLEITKEEDMAEVIDQFQGEMRWLSNFEEAEVVYEGVAYPTNEHAFQALKANNLSQRQWVCQAPTPAAAKFRGRKVNLRDDWEKVKVEVMYKINLDKFTRHEDLRAKLMATGDAHLVEGNDWGDRFWGVCEGKGANQLGVILMRIRSELRYGG